MTKKEFIQAVNDFLEESEYFARYYPIHMFDEMFSGYGPLEIANLIERPFFNMDGYYYYEGTVASCSFKDIYDSFINDNGFIDYCKDKKINLDEEIEL